MLAPKLRHRITIERMVETQDPNTGAITEAWTVFEGDVPADVLPMSSGEVLKAGAAQSTARYRFVIRYLPGLVGKMRVVHEGLYFNIIGEPIPDATLRRHMTLVAEAGLRDG